MRGVIHFLKITMNNIKPENWGKDSLSAFLELSEDNQIGTFINYRKKFQALAEINECYQKVIESLVNPEPKMSAQLFLRAHAAYLASCRLSASGHLVEIFPLCRSVIENSLYAYHMFINKDSEWIWINRNENKDSLSKCKKEFSYGNVKKTLFEKDKNLSKISDELYQRSIEYGAHPNETGVAASMKLTQEKLNYRAQQTYLHSESIQFNYSLKSVADYGYFPLKIAKKIWSRPLEISLVVDRIDAIQDKTLGVFLDGKK